MFFIIIIVTIINNNNKQQGMVEKKKPERKRKVEIIYPPLVSLNKCFVEKKKIYLIFYFIFLLFIYLSFQAVGSFSKRLFPNFFPFYFIHGVNCIYTYVAGIKYNCNL